MATKAGGRGITYAPLEFPKPPPPAIEGIEVRYVGMRAWREAEREAYIRAVRPAVMAEMKARKQ
jgi:hypothetical protein